jgi:outer membrane receptor protein involved in Fe transport
LPAHTVFDASAAYPVTRYLSVFLLANNLFDNEYIADALGDFDLRAAPRQVFGGVRVALP